MPNKSKQIPSKKGEKAIRKQEKSYIQRDIKMIFESLKKFNDYSSLRTPDEWEMAEHHFKVLQKYVNLVNDRLTYLQPLTGCKKP